MSQKHIAIYFFFFVQLILGLLFCICLRLAGWSQKFSLVIASVLLIFLCSTAKDYHKRIFQDSNLVRAKYPHPEDIACKKIIKVFSIATLASLIGYVLTTLCLSVHNPLIRQLIQHENSFWLLAPRMMNRPHYPQLPAPLDLLMIYPPESPGLLGLARYLGAFCTGIIALHLASLKYIPRRRNPATELYYRGRKLFSFQEVQAFAKSLLQAVVESIPWGGIRLLLAATKTHLLVVGASGSGKTITIRLVMQAVLSRICFGRDRRALIIDGKREWLTYLFGMVLHCPVKILNPLDLRCVQWAIARDCTDPATALEIAALLFPIRGESQIYFILAVQDLASGAMIALHLLCPGKWTFRDFILVMENPTALKYLLGLHPETRNRLHYFEKESVFKDILTTISTRIAPYRQVAAAWSYAAESISLQDWASSAFILVLSSDESMRQSLDAINQAIFKRATELLLAQDESAERETWIVLDELREAGKLDGLTSLETKGRSFGARVLVGFQDIEGLRAVYGEKEANEIAGLCSNKAILRLDDAETALWASKIFGEYEHYETNTSTTTSNNGNSKTDTKQLVKRDVVLPSQFLGLPTTDRTNGLSGYFVSPLIGSFLSTLTPEYLDEMLLPPNPDEPNFIPRPAEQQYLKPWTDADLCRLNLEELIDKSQALPDPPRADDPRSKLANPPPPDLQSVRRVERHGQE